MMLKLFVGETELTPVGIGAQKVNPDGNERLIVTFESDMSLREVQDMFGNLPDDAAVTLKNEKRELVYTGFITLDSELNVKMNDSGTYNYTVYLLRKSAYDIAVQNTTAIEQTQADIEYIAAVNGIEL